MRAWDEVGIAIRATAARADHARRLLARVLGFASCAVLSWHREGRSIPESYADALTAAVGLEREWVLQLEDDVVLARDFEDQAIRLLEQGSRLTDVGLISFFAHGKVFGDERLPDTPMLEVLRGSQFLMAQAFAMRASDVEDHNRFMLSFCKRKPTATDHATGRWLGSKGKLLARAWPSIVQHGDLPSLSGHYSSALTSDSYARAYGASV